MKDTTAHPWCDGHFTSIKCCRMWGGVRAEAQVSRREFRTHIHLDYVRVEIISCIKKNNNMEDNFHTKSYIV